MVNKKQKVPVLLSELYGFCFLSNVLQLYLFRKMYN